MNRRNWSVLIIIGIFLLTSSVVSGVVISPVCTAPGDQTNPAISGDTIVWEDYRNLPTESGIYKWDPVNGEQLVSTTPGGQANPAISGDTIVWEDYRNFDITGIDIYKWDPVNGEQSVCTAPGNQHDPAISGDTIVWWDSRNYAITGYDIYRWDPMNGEQPVCTAPRDQYDPAISGDTIVWEDTRNFDTTGSDLYKWDPVNGEQPVCTAPGDQYDPAISGDTIVWEDNRNTGSSYEFDIYMWDPVNGEQPVCTAPANQYSPAISGDIIVWMDTRIWANPGYYFYRWDPINGEQPVCTYDYANNVAISGNTIVWADHPSTGYNIYKADLTTTTTGAVTIVAAGYQSYYLGQEVRLSGTNTATDTIYLFITGPNLPDTGGLLTDPLTPVNPYVVPPLFTSTTVNDDNTWEYAWQTANLNIDSGVYTIYAVATPNATDDLSSAQYDNVSFIIRKPFVTAQLSDDSIPQGNTFTISGTALGDPSPGVAIWIIGSDYFWYSTEYVDPDGNFQKIIEGMMTATMPGGPSSVVVQHPMFDMFDIILMGDSVSHYIPGEGWSPLFRVIGPGNLTGTEATQALINALDAPGVEDTYTKLQFFVEGEVEAPVANFTANLTSGFAPLAVQFFDTSVNDPTEWFWSFGDGGTSTEQNPIHVYTSPGTFPVELSAGNAESMNTTLKPEYIVVSSLVAPVANFTASITSGTAPLTVQFMDQSTGSPTSWAWDFQNDGTVDSTLEHPEFTYAAPGTYTVNLTTGNADSSDSEVKPEYISVTEGLHAPVAAFSANKTSGVVPLTVQFTDTSLYEPTGWYWEFGDGSTSGSYGCTFTSGSGSGGGGEGYYTIPGSGGGGGGGGCGYASGLQNPLHTYTVPGVYTVNLTAFNSAGLNHTSKVNLITAEAEIPGGGPVAGFTVNSTSGARPLSVQFTDTSVGSIISRLWSFGDGTFVENVTEIIHTYTTPGNYTASLTVSGPDGDNTTSQLIHIFDDSSAHFFTVRLESGWNLFSTPVQLEEGHDQFSQIFPPTEQDKMITALGWGGSVWYTPQSTDTAMPLSAFFIKVRDGETVNATIVPSTVPSSPPLRSMTEGWNLIGPAPEYQDGGFLPKQVEASLITIDGNYSIVLSPALNQPGWSYVHGGTSRDLLPYKGYWVYMDQADVLAGFSTTPIS